MVMFELSKFNGFNFKTCNIGNSKVIHLQSKCMYLESINRSINYKNLSCICFFNLMLNKTSILNI